MANHCPDSRNIELTTYSSSEEMKETPTPSPQLESRSQSTSVPVKVPAPVVNNPSIPQEPQIDCGTCRLRLKYPVGSLCIQCPACRNITAVQSLRRLVCSYCRVASIFPASAELVRCQCGCVYQSSSLPNL